MTNDQIKEVKMAWAKGEEVQFFSPLYGWQEWPHDDFINTSPARHSQWRVKPATVSINGVDVTRGVQRIEKDMGVVFIASVDSEHLFFEYMAREITRPLFKWYERGLVHDSKESAIAHAKALLSFTEGSRHG